MKQHAISLSIYLFVATSPSIAQNAIDAPRHLIPIFQHQRWGFIDTTGAVRIPTKFRDIGAFSEKLAPARLNGTWGFIDELGNYILAPVYDYAYGFSGGYAHVVEQGEHHYIDKKGNKPFVLPDSTLVLHDFENGKALLTIVKNGSLQGVYLHEDGSLESYQSRDYSEGLAILTRRVPGAEVDSDSTEFAVIDTADKIIVPFGKYSSISPFQGGFAEVTVENGDIHRPKRGFINRSGQLAFWLPKNARPFDSHFSEGLLSATTTLHPKGFSYAIDEDFITWFDTSGNPVLVKPDDRDAGPFSCGRAFTGAIRNWYLMDKKGNQVGKHRFKWIFDDDFSDNRAIVGIEHQKYEALEIDLYGVLDSLGNYTITPKFNEVHPSGFQKEGLLVAVNEKLKKRHLSPDYEPIEVYWGLVDEGGNWLFKPRFTKVGDSGFQHGLLYAETETRYGFIDPKGHFVWSALKKGRSKKEDQLNIDYMQPSFYYVREQGEGRGSDAVAPMPFAQSKGFPQNELGIVVSNTEKATFNGQYTGLNAYVYNTSSDTLKVDVQDNCLYIVAQALDQKGRWQNIEYTPSSWCGNSYYDVKFYPDQYWKIAIPLYDGDFATTLRLAFTYQKRWKEDGKVELKTIYSNAYPGKVNPGQFWRKEVYTPSGIMDPYWE